MLYQKLDPGPCRPNDKEVSQSLAIICCWQTLLGWTLFNNQNRILSHILFLSYSSWGKNMPQCGIHAWWSNVPIILCALPMLPNYSYSPI